MSLRAGLIGVLKLAETSGDALDAFNGSAGDFSDNDTVGSGTGKISANARNFNGDSEFFSKNTTIYRLGSGDGTLSIWCNADALNGEATLWGSGLFRVATSDSQGDLMLAVRNNGAVLFNHHKSAGADTTGRHVTSSTGLITTGNWHHIVVTIDFTSPSTWVYKIWVDGVSRALAADATTSSGWGNVGAEVGRGFAHADYCFDGRLQQFCMWNRVLTDNEIAQLNNSGNGLPFENFANNGVLAGTLGHTTFAGSATFSVGTHTAALAGVMGHTSFAGSATFSPGTHTAALAGTLGAASFSGNASFAAGADTATLAGTLGAASFSGNASFDSGDNTAALAGTLGAASFAGSASFDSGEFIAALAGTIGAASFAGTASFESPEEDATLSATIGAATFSGSASFDAGENTAALAGVVGAASFAGLASFDSGDFNASLAGVVGAASFAGTASFSAGTDTASLAGIFGAATFAGLATFTPSEEPPSELCPDRVRVQNGDAQAILGLTGQFKVNPGFSVIRKRHRNPVIHLGKTKPCIITATGIFQAIYSGTHFPAGEFVYTHPTSVWEFVNLTDVQGLLPHESDSAAIPLAPIRQGNYGDIVLTSLQAPITFTGG